MVKKLAQLLSEDENKIREALANLSKSLAGRGVSLILNENEVSLATAPGLGELIEQIAKDEMSREIGKAGLETLAIILYNGPVTRREIDYIRGVNSTFILRNLAMRGLLIRESDPRDQRSFRYRPSILLLAHLGIRNIEELPEYNAFKNKWQELQEKNQKDE